jgi:hypothetical protein
MASPGDAQAIAANASAPTEVKSLVMGSSLLSDEGRLGRVSSRVPPRAVAASHGEENAV